MPGLSHAAVPVMAESFLCQSSGFGPAWRQTSHRRRSVSPKQWLSRMWAVCHELPDISLELNMDLSWSLGCIYRAKVFLHTNIHSGMLKMLNMPASVLLSPRSRVAFILKHCCARAAWLELLQKIFFLTQSFFFCLMLNVMKQMQLQALQELCLNETA